MPAFKHSMLIQQSTIQPMNNAIIRVGGWSESWYAGSAAPTFFAALCQLRAPLLPNNAAIVGQRIQQVDPAGSAQVFSRVYPGTAGLQPDIPQMALLCRARGVNVTNTRSVILRGLPDARVTNGEYDPSLAYDAALQAYFAGLVSQFWQFRGRKLDAATVPILSVRVRPTIVPETITVNTSEAFGGWVAVGKVVQITGSVDADGLRRTATVKVTAVDSGSANFDAINWPWGDTDGGRVREFGIVYPQVSEVAVSRVITRKVGRPFTSYRGRRSRRRRRPIA